MLGAAVEARASIAELTALLNRLDKTQRAQAFVTLGLRDEDEPPPA
jgi:hypothetical protein